MNDNKIKIIKDKIPSASIKKKLTKLNYSLQLNDYIQLYPKDIHALSKNLADTIENSNNISFKFDTEVKNISKNKNAHLFKIWIGMLRLPVSFKSSPEFFEGVD